LTVRRGINYGRESEYELFAESFSNYDVIDARIDVGAQKALIRMKGNPATSGDAASMLAAVKSGQLAGIYGDDLRAAAQLAARRGTVRWKLVPPGRVAALIREPDPSRPPTIIFRTQYRGDRQRLDPALVAAWRGFLGGLYAAAIEESEMEAFTGPNVKQTGAGKVSALALVSLPVNGQDCVLAHLLSNFDIDGSALKDAHKRFLIDRLVVILKNNMSNTVELIGRASRTASAAYNLRLSEKRVNAVAEFLLRSGIPKNQISTQFIGNQSPFSLALEAEEDRSVEVRPRIARVFTLSLLNVGLVARADIVIKIIEEVMAPVVRRAGRELKVMRSVVIPGDLTLDFDAGGGASRPCVNIILGNEGGGEILLGGHRALRVCSGMRLGPNGVPDHQSQLEHVFEPHEPEFAQAVANTAIHELGHLLGLRHVNDFSNFMHAVDPLGANLPQVMRNRQTMRQHWSRRGRFNPAQIESMMCSIKTGFFIDPVKVTGVPAGTPPISPKGRSPLRKSAR
jgi:outer membrane protein OmpA-like peptidoglycan-associated protein